jgi:hypothetical protein
MPLRGVQAFLGHAKCDDDRDLQRCSNLRAISRPEFDHVLRAALSPQLKSRILADLG